jgi:hypothetical protein
VLLALAMEGEGSHIIDIVGDASKGPLPKASTASSSSDASSSGAASDVAEAEVRFPWIHANSHRATSSEHLRLR